jgi:hypothetical protein
MGAATAAVLAVTTAVPTAAAQQPRPLTSTGATAPGAVVTLVTGDALRDGKWTTTVNHSGASGKQATLRAELTDTNGNSVTQTVTRAYDVR